MEPLCYLKEGREEGVRAFLPFGFVKGRKAFFRAMVACILFALHSAAGKGNDH